MALEKFTWYEPDDKVPDLVRGSYRGNYRIGDITSKIGHLSMKDIKDEENMVEVLIIFTAQGLPMMEKRFKFEVPVLPNGLSYRESFKKITKTKAYTLGGTKVKELSSAMYLINKQCRLVSHSSIRESERRI